MATSITDPTLIVRTLLVNAWNPANTESVLPGIFTGWVNPGGEDYQVTVSSPEESVPTPSGFTGVNADGPIATRTGSVYVDCWARKVDDGKNWKAVVHAMAREVERIILANTLTQADLDYLSVRASLQVPPDLERAPEFQHWSVEVGYQWRRTLA